MPAVIVFAELGRARAQVTLAGQLDGPALGVQVAVCPVQVRLGEHVEAVCTPLGITQVKLGWAEQGKGRTVPVQIWFGLGLGLGGSRCSIGERIWGGGEGRRLILAKRALLSGYRGWAVGDGSHGCHGDRIICIGGC